MRTVDLVKETWTDRKTIVVTKYGQCVLISTVKIDNAALHKYETMVFPWNAWAKKVVDYDELEIDTYDYPDVADVGHEQMVIKWMNEDRPLKEIRHHN